MKFLETESRGICSRMDGNKTIDRNMPLEANILEIDQGWEYSLT